MAGQLLNSDAALLVRGRMCWCILGALGCFTGLFTLALGAEEQTAIAVYPSTDGSTKATISKDGLVHLSLTAGSVGAPIELELQQFFDPSGNPVTVNFRTEQGLAETWSAPAGGWFRLDLEVAGARPGVAYSGEIWLKTGDGFRDSLTLVLNRAKPMHYHLVPADTSPITVNVPYAGITTLHLDVRDLNAQVDAATVSISAASGMLDSDIAKLYLIANKTRVTELPDVPLEAGFLTVVVDAGELPADKAYRATVEVNGGDESLDAHFEFTRKAPARTAVPVLEVPSLDLEVNCGLLDWICVPPPISVLLSEQQGRRLSGVFVTGAEPPTEPSNAKAITPGSLAVSFKGRDTLLNSSISADGDGDRRIEADSQQEVIITFKDELEVGRYKAKLRFGAVDADPTQFPEFVITLTLRNHWFWAVLMLTLGVLGSFGVTKGVATMYQRAETLRLLAGLRRNYWLRLDQAGTPPIVRMRAEFAKMQEAIARATLTQRLTIPKVVREELKKVLVQLPYVERLGACIAFWRDQESFEGRRARKALATVTRRLHAVPVDADPKGEIDAALTEMEQWQNPALLPQHYQQHLMGDLDQLLRDVNVVGLGERKIDLLKTAYADVTACVPDAKLIAEIQELLAALETQAPGTPHVEAIKGTLAELADGYATLCDGIGELRDSSIESPGSLSRKKVEEQVLERFNTSKEAESRLLFALKERLLLVTGLSGKAQELLNRIAAGVDAINRINMDAVGKALQQFVNVRAQLALSLPDVIAGLVDSVTKEKDQVSDLKDAVALERRYAALKVLWQCKDDGKLTEALLSAYHDRPDPDLLFRKVDDACWVKLQNLMRIARPPTLRKQQEADGSAVMGKEEAYKLITFEVVPYDPKLGDNFLFKHGLSFHWRIDFGDGVLEPVTTEPLVSQFVPCACEEARVDVMVHYQRSEKPADLDPRWFSIKDSEAFKLWDAFSGAELFGVGLVGVLAVVTGMNSEYLEPGLLGTLPDYLALFVWGFVADQARNILQNTITTTGETM